MSCKRSLKLAILQREPIPATQPPNLPLLSDTPKKWFSGDLRWKELQEVIETWYASMRIPFCHPHQQFST